MRRCAPASTASSPGSTPSWRLSWRWASRSGRTTSTTTPTGCGAPTSTGSARSGSWRATGHGARGQDRRTHRLRRGRAGRPGVGGTRHLVVHPDRPSVRPCGMGLHGRPPPLRIPRVGRAVRLRLLRPGGDGRIGLRAARAVRHLAGRPPVLVQYDWGFVLWAGVPVGLLAAALLQANNLRDIDDGHRVREEDPGRTTRAAECRPALLLDPDGRGALRRGSAPATGRGRSWRCWRSPWPSTRSGWPWATATDGRCCPCWGRRHVCRSSPARS